MQRNATIDSELVERIERMERTLDQQAAELREARKSIQTLTALAGKRQKRIELLEGRLRQYEPVPDDSKSQEGPDIQADHDEDPNRQDADPDRYSIDQATDPPKKRTKSKGGRKSLQDKIARTDRTEDIYPEDCDPALCQLVRVTVHEAVLVIMPLPLSWRSSGGAVTGRGGRRSGLTSPQPARHRHCGSADGTSPKQSADAPGSGCPTHSASRSSACGR